MSLKTLAEATGLTKGYLSRVERGERSLSHRRTMLSVADALRVPRAELTGEPYHPATRQEEAVRVALADTSDVLQGLDIGQAEEPPTATLKELEFDTARFLQASSDAHFSDAASAVPDMLRQLYAHVGGRRDLRNAARLLTMTLGEAQWIARCAGQTDLAWLLAERAAAASELVEDPALMGYAQFIRAFALAKGRSLARKRGGRVAAYAAADLQAAAAGSMPAAEVYGALHMQVAWAEILAGGTGEASLKEAAETANRTGNGTAFRIWFGPAELGVLRMAIALEQGRGGAAGEIAKAVNPAEMPSRGRQADYWIQVGRGLAEETATRGRAVEAFRRAERLAPLRTRMDPGVQIAVGELFYSAGGDELRAMAGRMGILPG